MLPNQAVLVKSEWQKSSSISSEINLLGCTVDEAISRLDKYLDDAYLSKIGAVQNCTRKGNRCFAKCCIFLSKGHPYVKTFRLGTLGEGDSGVTIVEFK